MLTDMDLSRIAVIIANRTAARFILAFWRLARDLEEDIGKSVKEFIEGQFDGQTLEISPEKIWARIKYKLSGVNKLLEEEYYDVVQDFLRYLVESKHDYSDTVKTPEEAFNLFLYNVRQRGVSRRNKLVGDYYREKSIPKDNEPRTDKPKAFEKLKGQEGVSIDKLTGALDERVDIKRFMETLDDVIPELIDDLPFDQATLFDLIFFEDEGTFKADIKSNMAQATKFREALEALDTPEAKQVLEKNKKRWSGYVGDTRKKLLQSIQEFINEHLTEEDYDRFYQVFFSDTTPAEVEKHEQKLVEEKEKEALEKSKRKLEKYKQKEERGELTEKEQKMYRNLKKKLQKAGVDIEEEPVTERAPTTQRLPEGFEEEEEGPITQRWTKSSISIIAARIAARI